MVKSIFLAAIGMSMSVAAAFGSSYGNALVMEAPAVMKALPIYSNDLIDQAPEGEVVTGVRDCFSSYFEGGNFERDWQNGVLGQYVLATDSNIYLRAACYSAAQISSTTDTYLKLEKVDDTTYVAHTPQLIWAEDDNGSIFTAYATRLMFAQLSATSLTYELQQLSEGEYDTDIYFTYKDGKLSQSNMNTVEMNGEIFPEELIGFTNSTGQWIGFGDGCLQIYEPKDSPATLPEGTETVEKSMAYTLLHVRDIVLDNATLVKYAEVGDEIYLSNPSAKTEQWIRGTIDHEQGTATFLSQYLGIDDESGYAVWFIPATYGKYPEVLNDETGFSDWFRTYTPSEKLILNYDNGVLSSLPGTAMCFSHSSEEILLTGVFAEPCIKPYENKSATPAAVTFTKFEPMDEFWGFGVMGFAIPSMDVDGVYIQTDELYYNVFPDGSDKPFVFSPEDYYDMEVEPMTDVPYAYCEDFDFRVSGVNHTVYFYHDWDKVGVQVIQKHNGVETRSEIVYVEKGWTGVDTLPASIDKTPSTYKCIENGEIVIVRDGVKYNTLGVPVK